MAKGKRKYTDEQVVGIPARMATAPSGSWRWNVGIVRFTQRDPIGLGGGLNQYGYAGGDPINNSDPFGLKVDLSRLDASQRARILALRSSSATFREWYDALDALPASQLNLVVQNAQGRWVEDVQSRGDGWTLMGAGTPNSNMLLSTDENWKSGMEFEAVVAHEFAHAAAGIDGGTPDGCYDQAGGQAAEDCAVREQNAVHKDIGLRDRTSYDDKGPFKPTQSPTGGTP